MLFLIFLTAGLKINAQTDQTEKLQSLANDKNNTVEISTPYYVNGTVTIPAGKIIKFENNGRISGHGTINGGIIQANYRSNIFDTTISINPTAVSLYFSAMWFGAKGDGNSNDYPSIQKSINTCIKNKIRTLLVPLGK